MSAPQSAAQPTVAILGASPNPERTSYLAVQRYLEAGWTVWPIHPSASTIGDLPVYPTLSDLPSRPEIISLYVRPDLALPLIDAIAAAKPDWVYCNPGTDSPEVIQALRDHGLKPVIACNLIALRMGDPRVLAQQMLDAIN